MANGLTAAEFVDKWRAVALNERAVAHEHFLDLCRLLGEQTPVEADPDQEWYRFEKVARKDSGGDGWADVWKRGHFAWEYKSQGKDLDAAFQQLRQYALALENPPLLIVSDMRFFRHLHQLDKQRRASPQVFDQRPARPRQVEAAEVGIQRP